MDTVMAMALRQKGLKAAGRCAKQDPGKFAAFIDILVSTRSTKRNMIAL
jgi:hypothetical protein